MSHREREPASLGERIGSALAGASCVLAIVVATELVTQDPGYTRDSDGNLSLCGSPSESSHDIRGSGRPANSADASATLRFAQQHGYSDKTAFRGMVREFLPFFAGDKIDTAEIVCVGPGGEEFFTEQGATIADDLQAELHEVN